MRMLLIALIIPLLLAACNRPGNGGWQGNCVNPHDIGLIRIIPHEHNYLKILVTAETAENLDAYVEYWTDTNPEELYYSPLSEDTRSHEMPLVNLMPETAYHFKVHVQNEQCKTCSQTYEFISKPLPTWLPFHYQSLNNYQTDLFDGYIHYHLRDQPGFVALLNKYGKVVWYNQLPKNVKVSHWSKHNTILAILSDDTLQFSSGKELVELDLVGNRLFHLKMGDNEFDKVIHHDIRYDENDNLYTLTYVNKKFDMSHKTGAVDENIRGDGILVFDKKGNKIWEWSVFDIMDPREFPGIMKQKGDWLHANALIKDQQGNYLISFRNIDQLWKIDGVSGKLIWKLGGADGDFGLVNETKFYGQHAIHYLESGEVMLLNNGNISGKAVHDEDHSILSKAMSFKIDEVNRTATPVLNISFPGSLFTASQGSVCYLNDTVLLYCSTKTKTLAFSDVNGELLGTIETERDSYRAEYVKELYQTDYVK